METKKKVRLWMILALGFLHVGASPDWSAGKKVAAPIADKEKLPGAWHLVRIDVPGPDGKPIARAQPKGMLIYTRDGHMSVQLMYPKEANAPSDEYDQDEYEA